MLFSSWGGGQHVAWQPLPSVNESVCEWVYLTSIVKRLWWSVNWKNAIEIWVHLHHIRNITSHRSIRKWTWKKTENCGSVFRLFSSIYQDMRTCSPHSATERVILTLKEYIWALSQWTCGRYLQRIKVTLNIVLNFQGQFSSGKNSYLQLTAIFNLEQTSPSPGIYQPIWAKIQNWPLN